MDRQKTALCMLMAMLVIAIPVSSYSQTQTIASNPDNSSVNVESDKGRIKKASDLRKSGDFKQAKKLLGEEITSQNPDSLAAAYEGLGLVFIRTGEFKKAESVLKQALQWAEASEKPDINANLARVFDEQGRFKEAEELHRETLSILEQELTNSILEQELTNCDQNSTILKIGAVRNNLGLNMNKQGRFFEAIKNYEHAIEIYEKKDEVQCQEYGIYLLNKALSYFEIYNYNAANVFLEKARRVAESSSQYRLLTAVVYGHLGSLALQNKDFKKANNYDRTSLEILEDLFDKTNWRFGDAYINLSRSEEVTDTMKAEKYLQEAIAIYQEAADEEDMGEERLIKGYRQYGQFLHRQGDYKSAEIKYTKANQIAEVALPSYKEHLKVADLKSDIGENYCAQKKSSLGLSVMQEALDILEINLDRNGEEDHLLRTKFADQKSSIANCENQNQQKNIALDSFREASKIYQEVLSFYNLEGPDYLVQRLTDFREHFINHILAIEQLERNQNRENFNETLALSQISQASRVSLEIRRKEAREQADPETGNVEKYQYYINERQQLESQLKEYDDNREIEKNLQDKIENITLIANYYKNEIPNYFEYLVPKALRLVEIQNRLEPKQAIINFIVTDSKVLSWGVTQDDYHFHSFQMDRVKLANKVDKLRKVLQKPDQIENFPFEITNELYEKLLEPFLKNFPEIDNLLIVPDGPLHSLQFGILTTKHDALDLKINTPPWLIKSYVIGILPSLETFAFSKKSKRFDEKKLKFIGFGDPIIGNNQPRDMQELFSQRGVPSYSEIKQLPRLPETAEELELIAKKFTSGISEVYLGNEATEKILRETNLSEANILIFATHAISVSLDSELNEPAIVLTPVSELDSSNDGLLTSREINNLKLNADLVILSACSTANTDLNANHAYAGLAQSFFFAGADSVLATHWDVETNAAAEITTGLISNLDGSNQLDFVKAFRLSILDVLDSEYSHPFYWAPFLIIGNN